MESASALHSYTQPLSPAQAEKLREVLREQGWIFEERPHALYGAKRGKLNLTVYEKGPKAVIQGKGIEDFILYTLEPQVLGEVKFGYDEIFRQEEMSPHFGVDESGKGDFFGPLVIAGVYVDEDVVKRFWKLGIRDSKSITSEKKINDLADAITSDPGTVTTVVEIGPERYNQLIAKMGNLNRLLAWGHARTIENLLEKRPDCPRALSDQFADPRVLERSLLEKGRTIVLQQRTKGESDVAVAAASILARARFVRWLRMREKELGLALPKGASAAVRGAARQIAEQHGWDRLFTLAKMHFKTAADVRAEMGLA